jgi:hypothetical protein
MYATDISPLAAEPPSNPLIYVWPPSSLATTLFIQYRRILPDIDFTTATGGLTVPWFPNQDYLLLMLKAQVGDLADDTRAPGWRLQAQQKLDSFLMLSNDDEGRAKTMKLDRRRFGQNYDSLPNTKTIGW